MEPPPRFQTRTTTASFIQPKDKQTFKEAPHFGRSVLHPPDASKGARQDSKEGSQGAR